MNSIDGEYFENVPLLWKLKRQALYLSYRTLHGDQAGTGETVGYADGCMVPLFLRVQLPRRAAG